MQTQQTLMEKRAKKPLYRQNADVMYGIAKKIAREINSEKYLTDKLYKLNLLEKCLAIQSLAAIDLFIKIKKNIEGDDTLVAGILLRSLIEVTANVNYIVENKSNKELQKAFLNTARSVPKKIYEVKSNRKISKPIRWSKISMSDRINLLSGKGKFLPLWHYLSSSDNSSIPKIAIISCSSR